MKCRQFGECHMKCYFVSPSEGERSDPSDDASGAGLAFLSRALLARQGARVLDPSAVPVANGWPLPRTTVYRTRTLLLPARLQREPFITAINSVLARVGMSLVPVTPQVRGGDDVIAMIPMTAVLVSAASDGQ